MMLGILCLVLAYIAGSFPSGLVIGKALYHTDIRDYGSHNTGATNAYRVLGAVGGLLVLICDVAKGMLGVYLGQVASQSVFRPSFPGFARQWSANTAATASGFRSGRLVS